MSSLRAKESYSFRGWRMGTEIRKWRAQRRNSWLFSGHPSWCPVQKQISGWFLNDLLCVLQRTKSIEGYYSYRIAFQSRMYRRNGVGMDSDGKLLDFLFKVCMCGSVLKGKSMSHCRVNIAVTCDKLTLKKRNPLICDAACTPYLLHNQLRDCSVPSSKYCI